MNELNSLLDLVDEKFNAPIEGCDDCAFYTEMNEEPTMCDECIDAVIGAVTGGTE